MMKDRNYILPKEDENIENEEDLQVGVRYLVSAKSKGCSLGEALTHDYTSKEQENVLLYFFNNNYDEVKKKEKMVSSEQSKFAITKWKEDYKHCTQCILIAPGKLSPDAKKDSSSILGIRVLSHDFFILPVGRHCLVPKHKKLKREEADYFLRERKLTADLLPHLKENDPVSQYYGYSVGDIIQVSRPAWIVYRVVVS
jgi:DNA-directed RNA polymerase subunit H (RpoH/RPB5)